MNYPLDDDGPPAQYGEPYSLCGSNLTSGGNVVGRFSHYWPSMNGIESMSRIVECVNAMAGITHPRSFVGNAKRLAEIIKTCPLQSILEINDWHTTKENIAWLKTLAIAIYANELSAACAGKEDAK